MSTGWIIAIIVIVLAIILSNIMLLKQTANMKMPSLKELEPSEGSKGEIAKNGETEKTEEEPRKEDLN